MTHEQPTVSEIAANLKTHEAVCGERYGRIAEQLDDLKKMQWWSFTAYVLTMAAAMVAVVFKSHGG